MKFELQKTIKKELDEKIPKKKSDWEHNIKRCEYNAVELNKRKKK